MRSKKGAWCTGGRAPGGVKATCGVKDPVGGALPPRTKSLMDAACNAFFTKRNMPTGVDERFQYGNKVKQ